MAGRYIHHAQTSPAFIRRAALDYELADDQELVSSQPVSLIQLCTRTNSSRNRVSKRGRNFHSAGAEVPERVQALPIVDRPEHWPRLPLPSYSNPAEYGHDELLHSNLSPRVVLQQYPWERDGAYTENAHEQAWHPAQSEYHAQRNPLNYASNYNGTQSRESSYMSESPFLRRSDWEQSFPELRSGAVDVTPITKQTQMDTPQSYSYAQRSHRREYIPSSSLQLYRDSYDRPSDRSPYESFRLKRPNRTDLPEINSGLLFGVPHDMNDETLTNTTFRAEQPNFVTHPREQQSSYEADSYQTETQKPHHPQDLSSHTSRLSSGTCTSDRTRKEIYAILDNMTLGNNEELEPMVTSGSDTQQPAIIRALKASRELSASPMQGLEGQSVPPKDDPKAEDKDAESVSDGTTEDFFKTQDDCLLPGSGQLEGSGLLQIEPNIDIDPAPGHPVSTSDGSPRKVINPPPGFAEPEFTSSFSRLHDVKSWFRRDGREEQELRRWIGNIAENFVDKHEILGGQQYSEEERTHAKQTISLFGDAVAILHAYKGSNKGSSTDYFANFEPLPSQYCEPSIGTKRSYFDF